MIFGCFFGSADKEEAKRVKNIRRLDAEGRKLFRKFYGKIDPAMRRRVERVLKEKDALVSYFLNEQSGGIRFTIMEQALKLVIVYVRLAFNYSIRMRELSSIKLNDIAERINRNNAKLGHLKNYQAVLELTKTIEMDEKLMKSLQEEKGELERISVKFDYIESTIGAFKHQILSSDCNDPAVEDIEQVIQEATALDTVLTARRKAGTTL